MNLASAELIKCLMWYDGPWIEYYQHGDKTYITRHHDNYGKPEETWLVIELTPETEEAFFNRGLSLLEVMEKAPALYEGPFNCAGPGAAELTLVNFTDIPPDLLPSADSHFLIDQVHDLV